MTKNEINREEALELVNEPLEWLMDNGNRTRQEYCGNDFDICTIINGKSGKCSENCKYCAQSLFYKTMVDEYDLLSEQTIIDTARENYEKGVLRYSIVTSGKRLSDKEVKAVSNIIRKIIEEVPGLKVCGSFGLLSLEQFAELKDAGLSRVHNNLETSRRFFPEICTTHTFDEKISAICNAKQAGLSVCSGGIFGLGESMEDRVDMAFTLRELGVKSVPINILNPIKGTPFEKNRILSKEEIIRIIAIYRLILKDATIRLAGGRGLLDDKGVTCFKAGANGAISGDMLTTSGITIERDLNMIKSLGMEVGLLNE